MKKLFVSMFLSASMLCSAAVPCALAVDLPTVSADSKEAVSLISNQLFQSQSNFMKTEQFLVKPENGNTLHIYYKNNGNPENGIFSETSVVLYRIGKSGEIPVMSFPVLNDGERYYTIPNSDARTYVLTLSSSQRINGYLTVEQKDGDKIELPFTDVPGTSWYQPYVQYDYEYGLFDGTSKTTFSPNMQMTRAQLVTVLGNMHQKVTETTIDAQTSKFSDVKSDMYYAKYVDWAQQNGLAAGYPDGKFHPDDTITREQMAVIINKYTDKLDTVQEYQPFSDEAQISDWAKQAVENMVKYGIMTGKTGNQFAPKDAVTRAESAAVIMHLHQKLI